jgi:hypothetical protein
MALTATLLEMATSNSMRSWNLHGNRRLVKVTQRGIRPAGKVGYVTQEKYLLGRNSHQIERDLGLKPMTLNHGAFVYALDRQPRVGEFEFKLSTAFPNGQVFDWKDVSPEEFEARDFWPPGTAIPQWNVSTMIAMTLIRQMTSFEPY